MLESIQISDFALIDSLSLDFEEGLTVLSGETGAGKSILIGALSFLLGGKGGTEVVRAGAQEARVSGTFFLTARHKEARQWLEEHGIELEDDRVLLRRYVKESGRSGAWIQGQPVTRSDLAAFSSFLVDIHGQHEHQSLLRVSEHRRFLDAYAGLTAETEVFTALYSQLVESRRQLEELNLSEADRDRRIELLSFALEEIEAAQLKVTEEEELVAEEQRLTQFVEAEATIYSWNRILLRAITIDDSLNAFRCNCFCIIAHLDKNKPAVSSILIVHIQNSMCCCAGTRERVENDITI